MVRLLTSPSVDSYTNELKIVLDDNQAVYLTGQSEQPVCYDANPQSCYCGYIFRHRDEYILYINDEICVNGVTKSLSMHPLQDGDQLVINTGCYITFCLDL